MTREQALQQAHAEGITLRKADNKAGYASVSMLLGRSKPYQAQVQHTGRTVTLGTFATAEEAALCVARSPEGQEAARRAAAVLPRTQLTREQALQQAQAEGITLRKVDSKSGFANVSVLSGSHRFKPYMAQVRHSGKPLNLGTFATAEEAALCVARSPEARAAAERAGAVVLPRTQVTREQAPQQAQAEGLALRKSDNTSGYANVTVHHGRSNKAKVSRGGKTVTLGTFATAEEAALCVARGPQSPEWQETAERAAAVALPRTQLTWKQQARDEIIGAVALEIIYQAAEAAAVELGAEVAAEVMAGIALGL